MQAEVFVLRITGTTPELAGPCGAAPWYIEIGDGDDPVEVVGRRATNLMGEPLLVHSTSWRRARGSVILSFVVVNHPGQAPELPGIPVGRVELARSAAAHAPAAIAQQQVLEHGLRHLAWLVKDDPTVRSALSDELKQSLDKYVPAIPAPALSGAASRSARSPQPLMAMPGTLR